MRRQNLTAVAIGTLLVGAGPAAAATVTIATVNNGDMIIMQELSSAFEEQHPDIDLEWVVLEENVLRQRVTTDIATEGGQFDVMTIGTYEVPIWAAEGWLVPLEDLPAEYDVEDVLKPVREVNALTQGVRAAIASLLKGGRPSVAQATADEEMFI